jgi:hypothetical protein
MHDKYARYRIENSIHKEKNKEQYEDKQKKL